MKILVVDDLYEMRLLISLMIQTGIKASIDEAEDGEQAMLLVHNKGPYDLIISDYNMPQKNGEEFYRNLRGIYPETPFLLISSEASLFEKFPNDKNFFSIKKPFDQGSLYKGINRFFNLDKLCLNSDCYVPIPIQTLYRLKKVDFPLYVKMSESKFLKVMHKHSIFNQYEKNRYEQKNIDQLYIKNDDLVKFFKNFRKTIFSKLIWESINADQVATTLIQDLSLMNKATKKFGWNKNMIDLALENVEKALYLIERNPSFHNVIQTFRTNRNMQLATHSVLICIGATMVLKQLGWDQHFEIQKMTFAALMHDMELDEETLVNAITLFFESDATVFDSDDIEIKNIVQHPAKAAKIVEKWILCPDGVGEIIMQHHENPQGTGFPNKLKAAEIDPLAAVFIVVEDLIYHCLENFNLEPKDYLKKRKDLYKVSPFNEAFAALAKTLG